MSLLSSQIRSTIRHSPITWARACGINLRPYQVQIARAVKDSVTHHRGLTFVVILPRQSGKNELQAHLFAWLLYRYANTGGRIVSVSPTFKPQTVINMNRVALSLSTCVGSRGLWRSTGGYIYTLGKASLQFYSGESRANVVGATADLLLSVDEAQDISILKFDKDFDPMTASTNSTRIFYGIPWASNTLLERERRLALQAQQRDGIQRLFLFTADDIRLLVPAYGDHLDRVIAEHGRDHPRVLSQYYCQAIDAHSGMFPPGRLALLNADQIPGLTSLGSPLQMSPSFGEGRGGEVGAGLFAFLLDVAGMDESASRLSRSTPVGLADIAPAGDMSHRRSGEYLSNPGRDATALTILRIDLSSLETLRHPTYHVVARHAWVGENHLAVFGRLKALADTWNPQHMVIDATGVGEGLWSLLDRSFPSRVIPVKFTQQEKSEIGWRFLSIIETGRFRDHVHTDQVRLQYTHCSYEVLPGPGKILRWGVPDGTRGPEGELIHDDFVLADSLVARLDALEWRLSTEPRIIPGRDPLLDMSCIRDDRLDHFFDSSDYDRSFGAADYDHSFGVGNFNRFSGNDKNVRYYK